MGIRFIYGRAGVGKTTFCLNQIGKKIDNDKENKLILLVPEQYTFQTEKLLLEHVEERGLLRAEVLSFKRLAYKVFNECGGRTRQLINESGKTMMVHKILKETKEELNYFNKIANKRGFANTISEAIKEFKRYNVETEDLKIEDIDSNEEDLINKVQDLKLIYNTFNDMLHKTHIDSDDELTLLYEKLMSYDIFDGAEVWIDEFTTFTPQQINIIKILGRRCKTVNITLPTDNSGMDIFNGLKSTEDRILRMMQEEHLSLMEPIDLNKGVPYRFRGSDELAFLEKNFFHVPIREYKEEINDIRLYKANNNYDEIDEVAKTILRLVRDKDYRYRDIAVVCREVDAYEKIISVILDQYDIPYFLDKKREIVSNPLVVLITSVFEIFNTNWSYESVFKYLKSGLVGVNSEYIDVLENYVLANGIKGYKWSLDYISEEELLIREIIELFKPSLDEFYSKIVGKKTVRELCTETYNFLLDTKVFDYVQRWYEHFEEDGIRDKIKEFEQVPQMVMDILNQAVEVLGNEVMDIKEFSKLIQTGFEEQEIGVIPMSLDQVNIGDIARVKGREIKALFVVGVNDGVLPSATKVEGILSDRDRGLLRDIGVELASDTKTKAFEEQFMVYSALSIASEFLMISYPMADFEGKSLRASIVIPKLKRMFRELQEESDIYNIYDSEDKYNKITAPNPTFNELVTALRIEFEKEEIEEYWAEAYKWFSLDDEYASKSHIVFKGLTYSNIVNKVPRDKIRSLYENDHGNLAFGVSRIEKYANCPFSYFVQYGLKAKDRKVYEFSAPDLGSFMHDILDKFTNEVRDRNLSWRELNKDSCGKIVDKLVNEKLLEDKNYILNSNKRYQYFSDRFKRTVTKAAVVISEQMKRGQFSVFKNEFDFGSFKDAEPIKINISNNDTVNLIGRIDRIDTLDIDGNTYIRVIDYKSSSKKIDLNELYYGLQIQLLAYLDALLKSSKYLLNKEAMPGAVLYFKIDDPIIKSKQPLGEEELETKVLEKLKMQGLLLKDAKVVKAMDNDLENGISLIIPAKFKKDGDFSSTSSVVTEEQFDILRKYVNEKMGELCEDMLSGNIKIEPCKTTKGEYCEYCDYSAICQFDLSIPNNRFNVISKTKEEKIWEDMERRIKEDGGN